jgi:hypothetical protein
MGGRWCNIVLNVHVPRGDDDSNDNFYEELQQVFEHFSQYNMKILSGDCNAKLGSKDNFKLTFGNENLQWDSNDNGFGIVNFTYLHHRTESCWRSSPVLS